VVLGAIDETDSLRHDERRHGMISSMSSSWVRALVELAPMERFRVLVADEVNDRGREGFSVWL
jgi:archaeosine-15-forming tRNA-guanine transglycosylase